jgi:hypothetical protein
MRKVMIFLPLALALGAAGAASSQPSLAQSRLDLLQQRDAQATAEAMAARNRDIALTNELSRLDARIQSDQAVANLQASRATPTVPIVVLGPHAKPPVVDVSKLASIPDAALARSNAAVRAAADNRR